MFNVSDFLDACMRNAKIQLILPDLTVIDGEVNTIPSTYANRTFTCWSIKGDVVQLFIDRED